MAAVVVSAIAGRLPNLEDRVRRAAVGRLKTPRTQPFGDGHPMNLVIVAIREVDMAASEPRIQQAMTCVRPGD